jgi:hypothetical protein
MQRAPQARPPHHPPIQQINVDLTPIVFNWGQSRINSEVVEEDGFAIDECVEIIATMDQRQGRGLGGRRDVDGQLRVDA